MLLHINKPKIRGTLHDTLMQSEAKLKGHVKHLYTFKPITQIQLLATEMISIILLQCAL